MKVLKVLGFRRCGCEGKLAKVCYYLLTYCPSRWSSFEYSGQTVMLKERTSRQLSASNSGNRHRQSSKVSPVADLPATFRSFFARPTKSECRICDAILKPGKANFGR